MEKWLKKINTILNKLDKDYNLSIPVSIFFEKIGYKRKGTYRGSIYYHELFYNKKNTELTFSVESAWSKIDEIEDAIHKCFDEDILIIWASEEFGCGIFETNDFEGSHFSKDYYYFMSEEESEYLDGEKELIKFVNEFFQNEVCSNEKEALDYIERHNDEIYGYPQIFKRELV